MTNNSFRESRNIMKQHLESDSGLYMTYQSNITMKIYDFLKHTHSKKDCNELAIQLMEMLWDIEKISDDFIEKGGNQ